MVSAKSIACEHSCTVVSDGSAWEKASDSPGPPS